MFKENITLDNLIENAYGPAKKDDLEQRDKETQNYYQKIRDVKKEYEQWWSDCIRRESVAVDEQRLTGIYENLQNLTNKIANSELAQNDEMFKNDALERIGEIEYNLFSNFDVMSWPVFFTGDKRIAEEKKARDFSVNAYCDQAEQIIKNKELYQKKHVGQPSRLLANISDPLYRLNYGRELEGNFPELAYSWTERLDVKKIINANIEMAKNNCQNFIEEDRFIHLCEMENEYAVEKIFKTLEKNSYQDQRENWLVIMLTDLITAEQTRQKLNELIEQNRGKGDESAVDNLEYARSFITPNHDKIAIENLQTFYQEKIKFEEYGLNQKMNEKEVELLQELIDKDDKVLEMGCGSGRLLLEMKKSGYDIAGYDYVERHVELVKEQGKNADVFQGDWHNNAIKDKSFNKVYSLGRNILHDYSIVDQVQLFREAHRMLKSNGQFIFDIPDRGKGGYKEMVDEYAKEMQNRGIKNFRYGAIYDSPDKKNFTTRYVYSNKDIEELARLTGFKIKEVKNEKLETGKDDENLYYVLEKV